MVNWTLLQNATSPDSKPTPGWLFHEICQDVRNSPKDCPDVAEYLMQCVCSDQLNIQLKAVLTVKHLAAEDVTFQQYMQSCAGALKVLEDIAAPPVVPQARSLEPQEVRTVRDATKAALSSIHTPHTVEKSTEAAQIKERIQGFGNFEPPPEEQPAKGQGVTGQVAEFVGDSIGDMVDDFREKGAVGALKDATIDALDLVLDGVDTVWGWLAGSNADANAPRICQPTAAPGVPGALPMALPQAGPVAGGLPAAPPPRPANPYAAAFGQGVVGANNPVTLSGGPLAGGASNPAMPTGPSAAGIAAPAPGAAAPAAGPQQQKPQEPAPAPMVDLLCMDEPQGAQRAPVPAPAVTHDLLGDFGA